jgi:hypothetical protein
MIEVKLRSGDGTISLSLEPAGEVCTLHDVLERLIIPALLAHEFHRESIDKYIRLKD